MKINKGSEEFYGWVSWYTKGGKRLRREICSSVEQFNAPKIRVDQNSYDPLVPEATFAIGFCNQPKAGGLLVFGSKESGVLTTEELILRGIK